MSPIFTFVVITLGVLAIFDIIVGVANDAVNFLNSAIGSKIAPFKVILGVAAVGILVGTLTSSGMMEVARSGVFYPAQFTFAEIMMLFLGMIVGDILLLDIFNTLGLPTSTTVSMVFGLLGAAVGIALHRIISDSSYTIADMSQFINTGKAMAIISAILLSVVLSFLFGLLFMYISRLIFSFRYHALFSKIGALWCGISFTGIIYFALFKGLKSSGLVPPEVTEYITANTGIALCMIWAGASFILYILQMFGISILKCTILAGTFSLALAFAGNDLVNFIGVPLAGYDSYNMALATGDMNMTMEGLMTPAKANLWMLGGAGIIMVLTLFFSKKAMNVTETELSLSSQNEGDEKFESTALSRSLIRGAMGVHTFYTTITPKVIQDAIERRFEQLPADERGNTAYDLIRATVNLTAASILISIATSFKLPLSTTYVVFMVAMGSSLADKAWGRESAVYRITGVMTVVMGWFLTAIVGFSISLLTSSLLIWGGWIAAILVVTFCLTLAIRSNFFSDKKKADEKLKLKLDLLSKGSSQEVLVSCTENVLATTTEVIAIYNRTLVAVFKENRKVLNSLNNQALELAEQARKHKYNLIGTLNMLEKNHINTGHFYVQAVDYISEVTKALTHITGPAYKHIDNNHQGLSQDQIKDLMAINDNVEKIFDKINEMLTNKDFSELDTVLSMRDELFDDIAATIKKQIRRIKQNPDQGSTRSSVLILGLLSETKVMILQARNLIKSQMYFIDSDATEQE
ncbi:MAG: inorganic phosphate transporter [Rikenellaceae bacterium]